MGKITSNKEIKQAIDLGSIVGGATIQNVVIINVHVQNLSRFAIHLISNMLKFIIQYLQIYHVNNFIFGN